MKYFFFTLLFPLTVVAVELEPFLQSALKNHPALEQYQQQMDAQRQQYEAKLARINQALTDAIAKQQRLIHRPCTPQ